MMTMTLTLMVTMMTMMMTMTILVMMSMAMLWQGYFSGGTFRGYFQGILFRWYFQGYFSGGAGYVLSQAAVKRLVQVQGCWWSWLKIMIENHYDDWKWSLWLTVIGNDYDYWQRLWWLNIIQDGLEGQKLCSPPADGEKGNEDVNMGKRFDWYLIVQLCVVRLVLVQKGVDRKHVVFPGACMRACNITVLNQTFALARNRQVCINK